MVGYNKQAQWIGTALIGFAVLLQTESARAEGRVRIGGGVHYWRTLDDIRTDDFDVEKDGFSYLGSVQFLFSEWVKLEADAEYFPEDFGATSKAVWSPQALLLLGSGLYGGLGIGTFYSDGEFSDEPFFILRAGFDIEVLPSLRLDLNANYQFTDFESISEADENVDTDTITLGAMVRFEF